MPGVNIINTESFAEIRQNYGYYVDKTGFLPSFLDGFLRDPGNAGRFRSPGSVTLFTRPRRFGKTLFMDMLASFFDITRDSRALFAGLKVSTCERLCAEWMNHYPVISLSLKDVCKPTYARALKRFQKIVCEFCEKHLYLLASESVAQSDKKMLQNYLDCEADEDTLALSLRTLSKAMRCHYKTPVVVLIDEYDVPVSHAEENGYYQDMIDFMRDFLSSALKSNQENLKFCILTGCLRITKESIFTGLNNVDCYDIAHASFSDTFGFTHDEVEQLLCDAGCTDKKSIVQEWYDGYHFGTREDIYCPWSIMKYVRDLQNNPGTEPEAYWVGTSGNDLTKGFAKRIPAQVQNWILCLLGGSSIAVPINKSLTYSSVYKDIDNFWSLLYLTGYLTLSGNAACCVNEPVSGSSILAIPNREVREVFTTEVRDWFRDILPANERMELYAALWAQDVKTFEKILTSLLVYCSFHDSLEAYYHSMLFGLFAIQYFGTISNGESGQGRYDIIVPDKLSMRACVLECKRIPEGDLEAKALEAVQQIRKKGYDARLRAEGVKTIVHAGVAFSQKSCKVCFSCGS
ncbi:MAG: AAA family ATPase [Desulfovibrionaceae bacterium]|nr:AAA family ATPase [Desulfovibrionaceae bacterium]